MTLLLINNLIAVYDNSVEIISVSSGLPNSSINYLSIGQKGNLLVGTNNGLYLYDGYQFMEKNITPFNSQLLSNDITFISEDKKGNIWLIAKNDILFISSATNRTSQVLKSSYDTFRQLISCDLNNLTFILCNDSILCVDAENLHTKTIYKTEMEPIKCVSIYQKDLFILSPEKLIIYNTENFSNEVFSIRTGIIESNQTFLYSIDRDNLICISGKKLIHIDLKKNTQDIIYTFPSIAISSSFAGNSLCVSTSNDVYCLLFGSKYNVTSFSKEYSNEELSLHQITHDRNGLIWGVSGKGIVKINTNSRKINSEDLNNILSNKYNIRKIVFEGSKQGFVLPVNNNLSFYNTTNKLVYHLPIDYCSAAYLLDTNIILLGIKNKILKLNLSNKQIIESFSIGETIVNSFEKDGDEIWVAAKNGLYLYDRGKINKKFSGDIKKFIKSGNYIFFISSEELGKIDLISSKSTMINKGTPFNDIILNNGIICVASNDGLYLINKASDKKTDYLKKITHGNISSLINSSNLSEIWFTTESDISCYNFETKKILKLGYDDGIRKNTFIVGGALRGINSELAFVTENKIIHFYPELIFRNKNLQKVIISSILFSGKGETFRVIYPLSDTIKKTNNVQYVQIFFSTNDLYSPKHVRYLYTIVPQGKADNWKELENNSLLLSGMAPGIYSLKVKAINSHGEVSKESSNYTFIVRAPFYQSRAGFILFVVLFILIILFLIQFRTRNLRKINREYKEKERIAKKIEQQKEELSLKNKNITDSINYARRIQIAMMPSAKLFKAYFPDSFLLHMPKDIVSGDFYWVNHVEDKVFFSAVDCTGHGVPGAFMSIIGVELFRRITEIEKITSPSGVLNSLSKNFERVFGDVDEMKLRDGMDLAFCSLNIEQTQLEFAGAFNPIYIIRDNSIIEVKGDRYSVGVYHEDDVTRSFNNHVISLNDGDIIYIFTDGFADQFGGPEGKKYKYRRFRHLLLALHQLPMQKQEEFLRKNILEWKGDLDQVDDILVMGLRIHQTKL